MAISPMMTGSAPLSPLRTRRHQIRAYSPSESAMISGAATWAAASSGASGCGSCSSVLTGAPWRYVAGDGRAAWSIGLGLLRRWCRLGRGGRLCGQAGRRAGGHQVDDDLGVESCCETDRGELAEVQHCHPVRDAHDSVEVVRDDV